MGDSCRGLLVEAHADPGLRDELKPQVASGEVRFCLGYTEPDGGSDIAGAKTRAVRDGDEWVINGQKIFTSNAQNSQYVFLITRTDPTLPKHKGLTMFLVPTSSPGFERQPLPTIGDETTNISYYSDIRLPDRYRIGEVNNGWSTFTARWTSSITSGNTKASSTVALAQATCVIWRGRSRPSRAGPRTPRPGMGR